MRATDFLNRFLPVLFGYDVFISYRRRDAASYAKALAVTLQQMGLVCFLDREETVGGVELAPALKSALRRSRTMVAILTPGVLESSWMTQELETFLRKRNRLIPINVDGFLSREDVNSTPFARLRNVSWLEETGESLVTGNPQSAVIEDIQRFHKRIRVRTLAAWFAISLLVALGTGGTVAGRFVIEGQRLAKVAYGDIHQSIADLHVLFRFLVFASQGYADTPLDQHRTESFSALQDPEVVACLEKLDLAKRRENVLPFVGLGPLFPPLDRRSTVKIVAAGAQQIVSDLERISRKDLPLGNRKILELTRQIATHPFIVKLASADTAMARYHEVDDSEALPYYVLRNPGTSTKEQYLDFVRKVEQLEKEL